MAKVFRMNDYDVVYAESEEQAIEWYAEEHGLKIEEVREDFAAVSPINVEVDTLYDIQSREPNEEEKESGVFERISGEWVKKVTYKQFIENHNPDLPSVIASTEW